MPHLLPNPPHVVEHDDCRLHYWSHGASDAPAVVLTHGATLDHATYTHQIAFLSDAGYRVIAWEMRGHGASRPQGKPFTAPQAISDLEAILDDAGVDEAVFVGQSFGAFLIQEFYRRHREMVAALVLVGAHVVGDPLPRHQQVIQRVRPTVLRWWPEAHLRKVIPLFLSRDADVRRYIARATLALSKEDLVAVTRAALDLLLDAVPLSFGDLPVLVVYGESEMGMIRKMIRKRAADDPALQVEVVKNSGHLVNQECPHAFNDVLANFLAEHVPLYAGA